MDSTDLVRATAPADVERLADALVEKLAPPMARPLPLEGMFLWHDLRRNIRGAAIDMLTHALRAQRQRLEGEILTLIRQRDGAARTEREACAQIAAEWGGGGDAFTVSTDIAAAIRARR